MDAIRHLGFVGENRGMTSEGLFVVAILIKIFCPDRLSSVQVVSIYLKTFIRLVV